jgi:hypothetical protein
MKRIVAVSALALTLSGCTTLRSNIIGGCELPAALAQKDSVADLPTDHPLTVTEQRQLWAGDRKHLKQSVDHGNALIDYVGTNCK